MSGSHSVPCNHTAALPLVSLGLKNYSATFQPSSIYIRHGSVCRPCFGSSDLSKTYFLLKLYIRPNYMRYFMNTCTMYLNVAKALSILLVLIHFVACFALLQRTKRNICSQQIMWQVGTIAFLRRRSIENLLQEKHFHCEKD